MGTGGGVVELRRTYETAFVLFIDVVSYSLQTIDRQTDLLTLLQKIVRQSDEFRRARANDDLILLPTGDGMALVFMRDLLSPVKCAVDIGSAVQSYPEIRVRMGVHIGPVCRHSDIREEINVVGGGINMAQRVMDCGDAGHILLSRTAAEFLLELDDWRDCVQDLGKHAVKHDVQIHLYNLCKGEIGNRDLPQKLKPKSNLERSGSVSVMPESTQDRVLDVAIAKQIPVVAREKSLRRNPGDRVARVEDVSAALTYAEQRTTSMGRPPDKRKLVSAFRGLKKRLIPGILALLAVPLLFWFGFSKSWFGERIGSIAILPFANKASNPDIDYLCEGLTDNIISDVSRLPKMKVMARSTVLHYVSSIDNPLKVGRELNVQAVVVGTVVQHEGRLIVRVEMVDVKDGSRLWNGQYERVSADIFGLQSQIASEIGTKLNLNLTLEQKERALHHKRIENTEAYALYLQGRYFWNKRTAEGYRQAIDYYRRALELDPRSGLPHAGLADVYMLQALTLHEGPKELWPKASTAAKKALELDDSLVEPHVTLGYYNLLFEWNWIESERQLSRAISLNPNYPTAHSVYGRFLSAMKRFPDAMRETEKARDLDPLSLGISLGVGRCFFLARQYDRAIDSYKRALELQPHFALARWGLATTLIQKESYDIAIAELRRLVAETGREPDILGTLGYTYALAGRSNEARELLAELISRSKQEYVSPYHQSLISIGLKDKTQALTALDKAYTDRCWQLAFLNVEPEWDPLRSDPRFHKLLTQVGLPR